MTESRGLISPRGSRPEWVRTNQGRYLCECGCGEAIELRVWHYNHGVPKYRHGHNPQPRKPRPDPSPCECGCGGLAKPGNRFVNGHNGRGTQQPDHVRAAISASMSGTKNHRYRQRPANYLGRWADHFGYIHVKSPKHPFANRKGNVLEHRLVVEAHLRESDPHSPYLVERDGVLYLNPDADVHHIDEVKDNNEVENLQAMWRDEHIRHHHAQRRSQ